MASGFFSRRPVFGVSPSCIIFSNIFVQVSRSRSRLPDPVVVPNPPTKRSASSREEDDTNNHLAKHRKLDVEGRKARHFPKLIPRSRKSLISAADRIEYSNQYRNSRAFVNLAVTLDYDMLDLPTPLQEVRKNGRSAKKAAEVISLFFAQSKENPKIKTNVVEQYREILSPQSALKRYQKRMLQSKAVPSLSSSISTLASPKTPWTPTQVYQSPGLYGGDSKFAHADFHPILSQARLGFADHRKSRSIHQDMTYENTHQSPKMTPESISETVSQTVCATTDNLQHIRTEGNQSQDSIMDDAPPMQPYETNPQNFTSLMNQEFYSELTQMPFCCQCSEHIEKAIDNLFWMKWVEQVEAMGEMAYDPMRQSTQLYKSRWARSARPYVTPKDTEDRFQELVRRPQTAAQNTA